MRILITGATGFLGNNIARALLNEGHQITAAIRHSSDPRPLSDLAVETVAVDLNNATDVNFAIADADVVIHSAAFIHVGWSNLEISRKTNVESTRIMAASARRKNVRMIHVSTVDALAPMEGNCIGNEQQLDPAKPPCSYVISKREAEQAILAEVKHGLDGVIVNPGFMVGPWDWKPSSGKMMIMLSKQPILYFAPAGGCSVVDVRDVAAGVVSAIKHGRTGERYILGGKNLSYLELWQLMAKVMERRPPVRAMSNWLAVSAGKCGDLISRFSKKEAEVNSASTRIGQMFHWYSSQKADQELGYQIGDVEDALRDGWDWFKKFGYV